jgi:hypothetical protein
VGFYSHIADNQLIYMDAASPVTTTATPKWATPTAYPKLERSVVAKYYADKAIQQELQRKDQKAALDGVVIVGASIGALLAFVYLKPEQAMLVLGGEAVAVGFYMSFDSKPAISKKTP